MNKRLYPFIFALFLSPLFAPYLINPNVVPTYSIPAFLLIAFTYYIYQCKQSSIEVPLIVIFILLTATALLISSSLLPVFYAIIAAFLFGYLLSRQSLEPAFKAFIFSIVAIVLVSLFAWLGWNDAEAIHFYGWALTTDVNQIKMNGPFANGNVLAIIIVSAWSFSAYLWLNCNGNTGSIWLILLLFFWIFIFSSMARGAWLAQFIILAWLIIDLIRRSELKKVLILITVGLIAWSAGDLLAQQSRTELGSIQQQFEKSANTGLAERLTLWKSVWEVWQENPLLGVGVGNLKAHYLTGQSKALENSPDSHGLGETDSAHNILLHLMAEFGIAGILLWLSISLLFIRTCWLYRSRVHSVRWPALATALGLWVQGHFNISLTEPYPLMLFALMSGISVKPILFRSASIRTDKNLILIPAIVLLSILTWTTIQTTVTWQQFGQWASMDSQNPQKGKLATKLAEDDQLFPYIVEFSIAEMAHRPDMQEKIAEMRPLIQKAISLRERPRLYKQLFFASIIDGDLKAACETGQFISSQNWLDEPNGEAYRLACSGIKPERYRF